MEKDCYKLMNNSVFRKTMENITNRIDLNLGDEEFALKQSKKSNFKKYSIFYENCITSHIYKGKV